MTLNQIARRSLAGAVVSVLFGLIAAALEAAPPVFQVRFSEAVHKESYTGRVYVIFSRRLSEPRQGPSWFSPEQFIARDVVDLKPGETVEFDPDADDQFLSFPKPYSQLDVSGSRAQAVVRFNSWEREIGRGPGNGFSGVSKLDESSADAPVVLTVDQTVPATEFRESRWSKLLEVESPLLSRFHDRPVSTRGAVILPASYYEQPQRRYPVILTIPGFGGTHRSAQGLPEPIREENPGGVEFIRVLLDPSCPLGHHVFADSANNGPVGEALVSEFLPELDRRYRTVTSPSARYLTGHSSGGWSSLWLQVAYPETFGGTWSTAPDPVDFRDFQRINLYAPGENMYVDNQGDRRPLARVGGQVRLWYDDFARMEWVLGHGGQLHSFEAVFSPKGEDGKPRLIWDRNTGKVDTQVAKTWEKYDIRLILERNWSRLQPKLQGKLHVFMGDADTFYLEGATILLKESLDQLPGDAVVEIHPGRDHSSLMTPELRTRIRREMAETFLKHHPDAVPAKFAAE